MVNGRSPHKLFFFICTLPASYDVIQWHENEPGKVPYRLALLLVHYTQEPLTKHGLRRI